MNSMIKKSVVDTHLKYATTMATLLESKFSLFGIKFGYDSIIGLIPGFGDIITTIFAFYLVWIGWRMNISSEDLAKMIHNIVIDFVLGIIPVVGDIADLLFKANLKNLDILKKYATEDFIEGEVVTD